MLSESANQRHWVGTLEMVFILRDPTFVFRILS